MHPFGGTPVCPRCSKPVYAAEQVMGPGRKLYHKPCLACTICNKRLDSFTLLEHDQQPYCKSCHGKNFGTHDLRQANLPHLEESTGPDSNGDGIFPVSRWSTASPPPNGRSMSPVRRQGTGPVFPTYGARSTSPVRSHGTGSIAPRSTNNRSPDPIVRPNRTLSRPQHDIPYNIPPFEGDDEEEEKRDTVPRFPLTSSRPPPLGPSYTGPANSGRGTGGLPRTVPLSPTRTGPSGLVTFGRSNSSDESELVKPLVPSTTGTRYGVALMGNMTGNGGSPVRKWGGTTPNCGRCGKSVYFAEQVKAVGKTWHKGCLRCTECGTSLDSGRLTEKDGDPLCHRCYNKLHGPAGSGYALLGKAGG